MTCILLLASLLAGEPGQAVPVGPLLAQQADRPDPREVDVLLDRLKTVFLPILLGTVFVVVLLVGGLMLYFRRGDEAVKARLAQARNAGVRFPGLDDEPPPTDGMAPAETAPSEAAPPTEPPPPA